MIFRWKNKPQVEESYCLELGMWVGKRDGPDGQRNVVGVNTRLLMPFLKIGSSCSYFKYSGTLSRIDCLFPCCCGFGPKLVADVDFIFFLHKRPAECLL